MDSGDHQWDARKMFDLYLHDYLKKKKLYHTAAVFRQEANVCTNPVAISSPDGFLHEWWTLFYDVFVSRQLKHQQAKEKSSVKNGQNDPQNIHTIVSQSAINQQRPAQFPNPSDYRRLGKSHPFLLPRPQQQQHWNQAQQLLARQCRNGISIPGSNARGITHSGIGKVIFPLTGSSDGGMLKVTSNRRLLSSPRPAPNHPDFPLVIEQSQQNLLGRSVSLASGNPRSLAESNGRKQILPKSNLGQMVVQRKQTEEQQDQNFQNLQKQLTANARKRRRLSCSSTGGKTLGCANAEVDKPVDEIESFLSTDDDKDVNKGTPLGTLKHHSMACIETDHEGFSFKEIGCLHSSKSKVLCCHFSSDGRLLASAGHDKKVYMWNMDTFDFSNLLEGHSLLITDVRFRPNSTILATSSFDKTLQIWDAAKPSKSLFKLQGHAEQVMALDFHPRKVDLICSCDSDDEIRLWNVNRGVCINVSKGATKQVRFQPQHGKLLATATGNSIKVFDVDNHGGDIFNLKGHAKEVLCLCWDMSGKYIASVSEDSARIWSLVSSGNCIHELHSDGNKFQSCTFHPGYSSLLVIGCYQSLELWNPTEGNKRWSVAAHNGLIAALAGSLDNEMIASASHDRCVKIWK